MIKIYSLLFNLKCNYCLFNFFILIVVLDGREINELTRQFLINWKASKEAKKKKNNKHMMTGPLSLYPFMSKSFF